MANDNSSGVVFDGSSYKKNTRAFFVNDFVRGPGASFVRLFLVFVKLTKRLEEEEEDGGGGDDDDEEEEPTLVYLVAVEDLVEDLNDFVLEEELGKDSYGDNRFFVAFERFLFAVILSPWSFSTLLYFSRATLSTCSVNNDLPEPRAPINNTELFSDSNKVRSNNSCNSRCCLSKPTTAFDSVS